MKIPFGPEEKYMQVESELLQLTAVPVRPTNTDLLRTLRANKSRGVVDSAEVADSATAGLAIPMQVERNPRDEAKGTQLVATEATVAQPIVAETEPTVATATKAKGSDPKPKISHSDTTHRKAAPSSPTATSPVVSASIAPAEVIATGGTVAPMEAIISAKTIAPAEIISPEKSIAPAGVLKPRTLEEVKNALSNFDDFLLRNRLTDFGVMQTLYQVHEDLRLVRKWTDLKVVVPAGYYDQDPELLNSEKSSIRIYLSGIAPESLDAVFRKTPGTVHPDRTRVIVPMRKGVNIPMSTLYSICRNARHPVTNAELRCVTLAFVDDDSTTAYYRTMSTWSEIVSDQWKVKKESGQDEGIAEGTEDSGSGNGASDYDSTVSIE